MIYTLMYDNECLADYDTYDKAEDALNEARTNCTDEDPAGYHIRKGYESEEAEYWANKRCDLCL